MSSLIAFYDLCHSTWMTLINQNIFLTGHVLSTSVLGQFRAAAADENDTHRERELVSRHRLRVGPQPNAVLLGRASHCRVDWPLACGCLDCHFYILIEICGISFLVFLIKKWFYLNMVCSTCNFFYIFMRM